MFSDEVYKYFGPISVATTGFAIFLLVYKWRGDTTKTISQNTAAHKTTYLMMAIVQSITLPMLYIYWVMWLVPKLDLPVFFTICAGITCANLIAVSWIPDTHGWKSTIHKILAYGAAVLAIPMLTMIVLSDNATGFVRIISSLVLVFEVVVFAIFAFTKYPSDKHLYLQAAYIFLFALATVAAGYL